MKPSIDINRLHNVLAGHNSARGCGKTYTMCVLILQQAEAYNDDIYVYSGSRMASKRMKQFIWALANDLGYADYVKIENKKEFELQVLNTRILFCHVKPPYETPESIDFIDHYYQNEINSKRRINTMTNRLQHKRKRWHEEQLDI